MIEWDQSCFPKTIDNWDPHPNMQELQKGGPGEQEGLDGSFHKGEPIGPKVLYHSL